VVSYERPDRRPILLGVLTFRQQAQRSCRRLSAACVDSVEFVRAATARAGPGIVFAARTLSVNHLIPIALEPVDGVEITILVDNLTDVFMPDEGPAKRFPVTSPSAPRQAASTLEGREVVEQLRGEHGFSALVTLTAGGRTRRVLFDTGVSPDGLIHNMGFLELAPGDVEAVVLSHGHFDHTTGLDGFVAP
jgi:hypothetical protein